MQDIGPLKQVRRAAILTWDSFDLIPCFMPLNMIVIN